ncbi:hypothetical protein BJX61DRAFT_512793 [Aspergillus egyptiacus]|nr:hypothetical protein BJX61DRAFT_512793 [Aspergillus egyptiacus]
MRYKKARPLPSIQGYIQPGLSCVQQRTRKSDIQFFPLAQEHTSLIYNQHDTASTMQLPITIISMLALSSALTLTPRAAEGDAVVECGDLDVMRVNAADLPEGVTPRNVRKCLEHPLGRNRDVKGASLAPLDAVDDSFYNSTDSDTSPVEARSDGLGTQEERACYHKAPYGCSRGYCWKACGDKEKGEWCWTAENLGWGDWDTCSSWRDCGVKTYSCGRGCPFSCGCSC